MSNLEERLQGYYGDQQPSSAFQENLALRIQKRRLRRRQSSLAVAALLILTAFLLRPGLQRWDLEQRVAKELASQFRKEDPRPFQALGQWSELSQLLPALQFAPAEFPRHSFAGWQPVGARYCSVQGQQAAQIQLRNVDGEEALMYVTQRQGGLQRLEAGQTQREGIRITRQPKQEQLFFLVCPSPES